MVKANEKQKVFTPQDIVEQARTWLGTKYHHQGRLKKSARGPGGVDCIGLVVGVVRELGLPDATGKQLLSGWDEDGYSMWPDGKSLRASIDRHLIEIPLDEIAPGDLLLFRGLVDPQHVGLATNYPTGGLGVIHCHSRSGRVIEHILSDTWRRLIVAPYRFRPEHLRQAEINHKKTT